MLKRAGRKLRILTIIFSLRILNLVPDVSWDEIRIAFGLKESSFTRDRDCWVGYATGRVAGAIVSCTAYVTTFHAMARKIRAERVAGTKSPYNISIIAYVNGRFEDGMGSVDHWDGIRDMIRIYKYDWKLEKAKTIPFPDIPQSAWKNFGG